MKSLEKPRLRDAIKELTDEKWSHYEGSDASTIGWDNPENAPSTEALNSKLSELIVEWEANQYQRDRAVSYPAIGDQLDMLFHAIDAGALDKNSDFYTTLKAVKDKYPKG